ncbi:hypothetical protein NL676_031276 [Syzygium grande]|nr:hypothetical protein NL676_031276 [Syzygium grande]
MHRQLGQKRKGGKNTNELSALATAHFREGGDTQLAAGPNSRDTILFRPASSSIRRSSSARDPGLEAAHVLDRHHFRPPPVRTTELERRERRARAGMPGEQRARSGRAACKEKSTRRRRR